MTQYARAVVLLSGGLDSATTLAMARDEGFDCYTMAVHYGQRHRVELDASRALSEAMGAQEHRELDVSAIGAFGGSALTDQAVAVPETRSEGIPVTYVPARNTLFLSIALGWAEVLNARAIFIGVNAVDYSGYPDCRPAFIEAFRGLAAVATKAGVEGQPTEIRAPLIDMTKAEIIRAGNALGVDYARTISCYQPDADGRACGRCDACYLRRQGFEEAGVPDPTRYIPASR